MGYVEEKRIKKEKEKRQIEKVIACDIFGLAM